MPCHMKISYAVEDVQRAHLRPPLATKAFVEKAAPKLCATGYYFGIEARVDLGGRKTRRKRV